MKYMLSYGMNTSISQMQRRCPNSISLGRVDIPGLEMVFKGPADVVVNPKSVLQCVLWQITDECEAALDILEGYPYFYDKTTVKVRTNEDEIISAMLYYIADGSHPRAPSERYLAILEEGYTDHGLSLSQIYGAKGLYSYPTNNPKYWNVMT